jgi:hypothetical protein
MVLRFLKEFIAREQRPPTMREVASYFGWKSTNAVDTYYAAMEKHGLIERPGHGVVKIRGWSLQWVQDPVASEP